MKRVLYVLIILVVAYACSSDSDSNTDNGDGFDRTTLTSNWVNNLLLPATNDLISKLNTLNTSVNSFIQNPDESKLLQIRTNLFEAYKVYQHVEMFFYGTGYALDMNSYPTNVIKIKENIDSTEPVDLNRTVLNPTQGLPALDYLVNGLEDTDAEIIIKYGEAKYKNYLELLVDRMINITTTALSDFEATQANKIASVDNTISSYFSVQVNDYIQYTEKSFREAKIANPSGTRNRPQFENISVPPKPNEVESVYSPNNSKTLYLEAYDAIKDFYYGRNYTTGAQTIGFQNYLQFLNTTILVDGQDILLDDYIESLFMNIETSNNNITNNFFEQTQDYNPSFDAVFDAIQEYVVATKSNMINAFNLTIDFVDSDGD